MPDSHAPKGHVRRYARRLREAALHATEEEAGRLETIERQRRSFQMNFSTADELVRDILRAQNARRYGLREAA